MFILAAAALVAVCIAIVVYPFVKSGSRSHVKPVNDRATTANSEVEAIFDAIRTLQLEYQLGNIVEGLYQEQLRAYRVKAASILRQQSESQPDLGAGYSEGVTTAGSDGARADSPADKCTACNADLPNKFTPCSHCGAPATAPTSDSTEGTEP